MFVTRNDTSARGVLYPGRLPSFHRLPAEPSLAHAVRWFWIPEWDLQPGASSRQEVLPYPACNLVVEPHGVTFIGPPTRRSERVLEGRGWAVGALLQPVAARALHEELSSVRDAAIVLDAPELLEPVVAAMGDASADPADRRDRAARLMAAWIQDRVPAVSAAGKLAQRMGDVLLDPTVVRVDQLTERLGVSASTVRRTANEYFGLSPHSMIRRRRLQEGAEKLRADETLSVTDLANELGYADHAHFTNDFTSVLGVPPTQYRAILRRDMGDRE